MIATLNRCRLGLGLGLACERVPIVCKNRSFSELGGIPSWPASSGAQDTARCTSPKAINASHSLTEIRFSSGLLVPSVFRPPQNPSHRQRKANLRRLKRKISRPILDYEMWLSESLHSHHDWSIVNFFDNPFKLTLLCMLREKKFILFMRASEFVRF